MVGEGPYVSEGRRGWENEGPFRAAQGRGAQGAAPGGGGLREPVPRGPLPAGASPGRGAGPLTRFSTVSTMSRLLTSPTWMSPMRTANFIRMLRIGTDGLIIPAGSTTDPEPDALSSPITATLLLLLLPPPPPPPAPTEMSPAGCGSGPDTGFSLAIYPPPLPAPAAAASPPGRAKPRIHRSRTRRGRREPARGAGTVPGAAPPLRYNEGLLWAPMPR